MFLHLCCICSISGCIKWLRSIFLFYLTAIFHFAQKNTFFMIFPKHLCYARYTRFTSETHLDHYSKQCEKTDDVGWRARLVFRRTLSWKYCKKIRNPLKTLTNLSLALIANDFVKLVCVPMIIESQCWSI